MPEGAECEGQSESGEREAEVARTGGDLGVEKTPHVAADEPLRQAAQGQGQEDQAGTEIGQADALQHPQQPDVRPLEGQPTGAAAVTGVPRLGGAFLAMRRMRLPGVRGGG